LTCFGDAYYTGYAPGGVTFVKAGRSVGLIIAQMGAVECNGGSVWAGLTNLGGAGKLPVVLCFS
jgi:hypothetical protein